ncbi:HK97 gp10 family phage protein [Radiobacillus sp. PE A8.2]|uniref:HK97 gp10 family phage protein n=1 Tax=Radiobacillus sp. PE A8.2 TaxID=3380349 RepID=UPI00388FE472
MAKSKFQQAKEDMRKKRELTMETIIVFAEGESKLRAPVKTGHLRRSITHKTEHNENISRGVIGSNVEYDPVIELGSVARNIKAQPHHRPAIEENFGIIGDMIQKGMSLK